MKNPNCLQKILWTCAGATVSILKRQETEHAKYTVIGTAVLLTGILAGFTGGRVFSICFQVDFWWSVVFGILWGFIILNIDRSFIINTGKGKSIVLLLTRFSMAILISLSLSTIIELDLFSKEINTQIKIDKLQEIKDTYKNDVNDINKQLEEKEMTLTSRNKERKNLFEQQNITNKNQTLFAPIPGQKRINKDNFNSLKLASNTASKRLSAHDKSTDLIMKSKDELTNKLIELEAKIPSATINMQSQEIKGFAENSGLIDRYKALKKIVSANTGLWALSLIITAIMTMIEISPLLSKSMYAPGDYDEMVAKRGIQNKKSYQKELTLEKETLVKTIEITHKRLNAISGIDPEVADSVINPLLLTTSNNLLEKIDNSLNPDSHHSKYEHHKVYTNKSEKDEVEKKKGSFFGSFQEKAQIHEMLEWFNKFKSKKIVQFVFFSGVGASTVGLYNTIDKVGGFAKNVQALIALFQGVKVPGF
jgi:hypothetical protein